MAQPINSAASVVLAAVACLALATLTARQSSAEEAARACVEFKIVDLAGAPPRMLEALRASFESSLNLPHLRIRRMSGFSKGTTKDIDNPLRACSGESSTPVTVLIQAYEYRPRFRVSDEPPLFTGLVSEVTEKARRDMIVEFRITTGGVQGITTQFMVSRRLKDADRQDMEAELAADVRYAAGPEIVLPAAGLMNAVDVQDEWVPERPRR